MRAIPTEGRLATISAREIASYPGTMTNTIHGAMRIVCARRLATGGGFWGTNALLSTVHLVTRAHDEQTQSRSATIAATRAKGCCAAMHLPQWMIPGRVHYKV